MDDFDDGHNYKVDWWEIAGAIIVMALIIVGIVLLVSCGPAPPVPDREPVGETIYIPIGLKTKIPNRICFESKVGLSGRQQKWILDAKIDCVKVQFDFWEELEPVRGTRNLGVLEPLDEDLRFYNKNDIQVYMFFVGAPEWARGGPGTPDCSPVLEPYWEDYTNLIAEMLDRYRMVRDIEIWNEPDAVLNQPPAPSDSDTGRDNRKQRQLFIYGCWGRTPENYWRFFQFVVDRFPNVNVRNGGLMMAQEEQGDFLLTAYQMGIILTEIQFHHYGYSDGGTGWLEGWSLDDKVEFIQELYPDAVLWLNETNLLSDYANCEDPTFQNTQAHFNMTNFFSFEQTTLYRFPSSGWRCANVHRGSQLATYNAILKYYDP